MHTGYPPRPLGQRPSLLSPAGVQRRPQSFQKAGLSSQRLTGQCTVLPFTSHSGTDPWAAFFLALLSQLRKPHRIKSPGWGQEGQRRTLNSFLQGCPFRGDEEVSVSLFLTSMQIALRDNSLGKFLWLLKMLDQYRVSLVSPSLPPPPFLPLSPYPPFSLPPSPSFFLLTHLSPSPPLSLPLLLFSFLPYSLSSSWPNPKPLGH